MLLCCGSGQADSGLGDWWHSCVEYIDQWDNSDKDSFGQQSIKTLKFVPANNTGPKV